MILTGRREDKREATASNLERAGYTGYLKLIVKYVAPSLYIYTYASVLQIACSVS